MSNIIEECLANGVYGFVLAHILNPITCYTYETMWGFIIHQIVDNKDDMKGAKDLVILKINSNEYAVLKKDKM